MKKRLIQLTSIVFNLILCNNVDSSWIIDKGYNQAIGRDFIALINTSTNEERITSDRIHGEFKIYCDGENLNLLINWGEFANFSDANIYYYLNGYDLWEENWVMSKNGERSYSPDPLLFLLQLTTTDSLAIGIRPKYSNEIRYYFNNKGLSNIIIENQNIFGEYSEIIKQVFDNSSIGKDKTYLKNKLHSFIFNEKDIRSLRVNLNGNDKFFFEPIWYESKLLSTGLTDSGSNNIIFFNRWLKKKGTLFTDNDVRVTKLFSKKPKIIQYADIHDVEIKGNTIIGYRIHINNKYFSSFSNIKKNQIEEVKNFLINRSKYSSKG
ncbi:MAG: hypothetical protein CMG41_06620 [Candidatus Marinimicrobia bacterium]|nr:hypothetical protein [Candidatus Neomarinimicrobiota bacterium]